MTPSDIQFDPFWCWLNSCTCEEWSFLQSLASRWCSCGTGKGRQWRASSHQIYPLLPTSQPQHRRIRRVCAEFWLVTQSPIHHGRHLQKIQFHALKSVMFVQFPLQLALDSARFEFTLKMRLNRIWPKDPTYAIFLKSWVFKDVKYDIPMCQYHSTRPQPIQLVPTMQKKLFTSSFQPKFLKIWFTKVAATSSKSYVAANFFVPQSQVVLGACFEP